MRQKVSKFFKQITIAALAASFLFGSQIVFATGGAKLWLVPNNESRYEGETFSVNFYLTSLTNEVNAVVGRVNYNPTNFEVVNTSKVGSIFSVWVTDPQFNNEEGYIEFSGGLTSPGFSGAQGLLFSASFKAKAAGPASLVWEFAQVLANDGNASNVLGSMEGSSITILPAVATRFAEQDVGKPKASENNEFLQQNPEDLSFFEALGSQRVVILILAVLVLVFVILFIILLVNDKKKARRLSAKSSTQTLVEERFLNLKKNLIEELWHLEKKMKRGEPFSREERERREKLLRELGENAQYIESKLDEI